MVKRKKYQIKNIIEIEEYHDGRYGAPGSRREKKKKPTKEQMERVNQYNKEKNARRRLLKYFEPDRDWFLTLTYRKEERPPDMKTAKLHFKRFLDVVRREYKKRGVTLYWIRNIENTATNNWHIHLVLSDIPGMNILVLLKKAWPYGRVKDPQQLYERDQMRTLAAYVTKSEKTKKEYVPEGILDHRVTEASYSTSRNMQLPEPEPDLLLRWKKEPYVKKGYYLDKNTLFEGINPVTGYKYRHYTLVQIVRRE